MHSLSMSSSSKLCMQVVVADAATMRLPTKAAMPPVASQVFSGDMPLRIPLPRWDCDAPHVTQLGGRAPARFAGIMPGAACSVPPDCCWMAAAYTGQLQASGVAAEVDFSGSLMCTAHHRKAHTADPTVPALASRVHTVWEL